MANTKLTQIKNLIVWSQTYTGAGAGAGLLVTDSDQIGRTQRWRVQKIRFFATAFAAWADALAHGALVQLEDGGGFVFCKYVLDIPGATAAGIQGHSSPWMEFDEGLIGDRPGLDLRFRIINSASVNLGSGYLGVQVAARVESYE